MSNKRKRKAKFRVATFITINMFLENSENADWSDGINRAADELTEWLAKP